MANLRERLKRIQEQKKSAASHESPPPPKATAYPACVDSAFFERQGWVSCGFQSLKREITIDTPFDLPDALPPAMMIVVPDMERICSNRSASASALPALPKIDNFLFFDLETSGLSGGAGTVAFLAAFGKFVRGKVGFSLRITQYLLLDYPGESDFLEAALCEFGGKDKIIVSYNGKTFDSQIIKTRCLMNRIQPPEYVHVDLLHPARRLWKSMLENCSQGTIETGILGLNRDGDIPGALAPEIWFDFLKTGNVESLRGICDHNCRDISGLAAMLCAMVFIAADPCGAVNTYRYDIEQLALRWRFFLRQADDALLAAMPHDELRITEMELLRIATQKKYPKASLVYAQDHLRGGKFSEGRKKLLAITASAFPENIRAAALRSLAIDSERRLGDPAQALEFARQGQRLQLGETWQKEFEHRCKRLEKKYG